MLAKFGIAFINKVVGILSNILGVILSLLPNSPFTSFDNSAVSDYLAGLNWIIPIGAMISILELWVTAILVYYAYMVVLRWIKALG